MLETITELSHEFGTDEYLKAGGGNTSVKDTDTLWVKPSGTTLSQLSPETFVAVDRAELAKLYDIEPPSDPHEREAMVKELMMAAKRPGSEGRPSVEAPLHSSISSTFVVHTHPMTVNGMTCSKNGKAVCASLFPEALWIDYIDPGFTLCMKVLEEVRKYAADRGRQPKMIFLENHGVFVGGDSAKEIRETYAHIMSTIRNEYKKAGVSGKLEVGPAPAPDAVEAFAEKFRNLPCIDAEIFVRGEGYFKVADGPISPDHIVYMKSFPMFGEITADAVSAFTDKHGYFPRIVICEAGIFGIGTTEKNAEYALVLAKDGTVVAQLAEAFGGIQFMTDLAQDFIDNWEVEAYRRKIAAQ